MAHGGESMKIEKNIRSAPLTQAIDEVPHVMHENNCRLCAPDQQMLLRPRMTWWAPEPRLYVPSPGPLRDSPRERGLNARS